MTYCLAIRLDQGLVFGTDSRTNAGVDYVTAYRKMHVFRPAADRIFVVLSAGNLATTQQVLFHIQRDLDYPDAGANLGTVRYLFEADDGATRRGRVAIGGECLAMTGWEVAVDFREIDRFRTGVGIIGPAEIGVA